MSYYNSDRFRIYYDAEFTGLHRNTTLVSIGMSTTDGTMFYGEFTDYDQSQADDWLKENVINKLPYAGIDSFFTMTPTPVLSGIPRIAYYNVFCKGTKEVVGNYLLSWLANMAAISKKKIQFYTDCYAYDWMLLNDLICPEGKALNLPEYIDYIPIDLSTALAIADVDPDITREDFIGDDLVAELAGSDPFHKWGENIKHNSLWDAKVAQLCFLKCYELIKN